MKNHWYPLLFAKSLHPGHPHADTLFGEPIVLFRDDRGHVQCLADRYEQRFQPLSPDPLGNEDIEDGYPAWSFDREDSSAHVPTHTNDQSTPPHGAVRSYPVIERGGLIWVWPGKKAAADPLLLTMTDEVVSPGWIAVDLALDWQMDPDLAIEIILDQAHVPFVHVDTPGHKDQHQPIDLVLYHRAAGFQGCCRYPNRPVRYPLWITFNRPSTVRIDFLTKQAGRLLEQRLPPSGTQHEEHLIEEEWVFLSQLFYVVPIAAGKTRVLTRTLRNWATGIPFMDLWMRHLVKKILAEDLVALQALQLRIEQGANPWSRPVRADSLPLAYRRWRTGMETAQRLD